MRTAEQVFEDHLDKRATGDLEDDIRMNYSPDVVLMTGMGIFRGHAGVRELADELAEHLGDGTYTYINKLTDGNHAFVEWKAQGLGTNISDGADSFMIDDGKIIVQTIHYTVNEDAI